MGLLRLLYRAGSTGSKARSYTRGPSAAGRNYVRRKAIKSIFRWTR